ncbi:MAG: hypothetical protein ABII18_10715 [bacterium]|nr:hypothetical protein [bacterium]MBU1918833.1 hypothetical protein [bacterium]
MKKILFILLTIFIFSPNLKAQETYDVKSYQDKGSAGWAYKTDDYAFVVEIPDCLIKWNAEEFKSGKRSLSARMKCDKPFKQQTAIHKAILTKLNEKWPLKSFKSIFWGQLCTKSDWSWCIPIAKASITSADYIDYWKHYPNSKITSINKLFVELANKSNSYKGLADLFIEFGVTIKLDSVEKVFEYRLKETPFYDQLKAEYPIQNPRVMFNVGMAYFAIQNP